MRASDPMRVALRPWARRLALESIGRWLVRGSIAALVLASLVLSIGWLLPIPMEELWPIALQLAMLVVLMALIVGAWPTSMLRRAVEIDTRLKLADRLATAWQTRGATRPIARLQRADALAKLGSRSPRSDLPFQWHRVELGLLAAVGAIAAYLYLAPSPMRAVLEQQQAEQRAAQQAAEQIEAVRLDVTAANSLTPEQARMLDELLHQAQLELARARSEQEALGILSRTEAQLGQIGNPMSRDLEDALAAMSETLTQEPMTRSLGEALQRNEPNGASEAIQALEDRVDQLSDVQRQALARALQRAANVGRSDPASSAALRDAARAIAAGEPSEEALEAASEALRAALQASTSEATLRSTAQRLQDVRADLTTQTFRSDQDALSALTEGGAMPAMPSVEGEPIAVDAAAARRGGVAAEPGAEAASDQSPGGGVGGQALRSDGREIPPGAASENVFVPGRSSDGPADQDMSQQPFTIRGQPRPYREVLAEYAQSGRDYIERANVNANVRELVKQYFAGLEGP